MFLYFYLVLGNLHWFQHLEIENFFAIFVLDTHAVPAYRGQTLFTLLTNKVLSDLIEQGCLPILTPDQLDS